MTLFASSHHLRYHRTTTGTLVTWNSLHLTSNHRISHLIAHTGVSGEDVDDVVDLRLRPQPETSASDSGPTSKVSAPNAALSLLLWDGTTAGTLDHSSGICSESIGSMKRSLHSSLVYADCPVNSDEDVRKMRCAMSSEPTAISLNGATLAITSNCMNVNIRDTISSLKPGTWIRIRNLHLLSRYVTARYFEASSDATMAQPDICEIDASSSSFSSSSSSSSSSTSTSYHTSSSSSSSFFSAATALPTSSSLVPLRSATNSAVQDVTLIGVMHPDTHISILKPFFK